MGHLKKYFMRAESYQNYFPEKWVPLYFLDCCSRSKQTGDLFLRAV